MVYDIQMRRNIIKHLGINTLVIKLYPVSFSINRILTMILQQVGQQFDYFQIVLPILKLLQKQMHNICYSFPSIALIQFTLV